MTSGYVTAEPLRLPFEGGSDIPAHCSHAGAKAAAERAGRQALALLAAYREHGPLTDAEAAYWLNVERTTINARRAELMRLGLVKVDGVRKNPKSNISNATWGLV